MKRSIYPRLILTSVFLLLIAFVPANSTLLAEVTVYFNVNNHKVHQMTCRWGRRCTKSCIVIPRREAYQRGGVACKVCGG